MKTDSFIHFLGGEIRHASNDGMELLGHFLLTQVGAKGDFFLEMLREGGDREVAAGPYFVQTIGDKVRIDHLELESVFPFETSRKNMLEIVEKWVGYCGNPAFSVCDATGLDLMLKRSVDDDHFAFETNKISV